LILALYAAGLAAYGFGMAGGLAGHAANVRSERLSNLLCGFSLIGALLELAASAGALASGADYRWAGAAGVPYLSYSIRLDPLGAFFTLALSAIAAAVAVYSAGYLQHGAARRSPGLFCFFLNLLLLSLTLVFTASNVLLFLIVWELMALAAYFLVVFDHQSAEARHGGLLYLLMSRGGTGMLLCGFLLLASGAGSLEFTALHGAGQRLGPVAGGAAFLLLFLGFGVKAGIIPLHIWLPAAHPVAPSNISALMSGIVIKTGIYGMARVFFDFYGELPAWAGTVVLVIAVASALLGVLYALMEHDLKRLLAYHSIENIGIILMGFGSALLFRSYGYPRLAALALIAGLFHTLNHAIFKCLLFLGAGSVLQATGTRNMEKMGGLIRRMPATALFFLVGAIAISGLPPLNGFVSEWLTYQALLGGFGATTQLTRIGFPVAGALLALTAALAAACFVKAFGITFLALPRSEEAAEAREVAVSMRAAMAALALACAGLGLGATWFLPLLDPIVRNVFGIPAASQLIAGNGWLVTAGQPGTGSISPAVLALLLVGAGALPLLLWAWVRKPVRTRGPAWDCGLPGLTADNEYTATAFSKPLRMIFAALFRPRREIQTEFDVSPYYPRAIHFESEIEPAFEKHFYDPLRGAVLRTAAWMRGVQAGSVHLYLAYVFAALILLLLFGARG
jgi:hydrogenase-4 component B